MISSEYKISRRLTQNEKIYGSFVLISPFIVTLYSIFSGMLFHMSLFTLLLLVSGYCVSMIGVTVGYHRLLTHRSFQAHRAIKIILIYLGCLSFEGSPLFWVAAHRRHHKYTEKEGDPHSPVNSGQWTWRSLSHAHFGWMLDHEVEDWNYYVRDLVRDKDVRMFNRHYKLIAYSGLIIPGMINGLVYLSWYHFIEGIVIGGFVRVFLQQNITWAINSVCHVWGRQDFYSTDNSKNNWLFALLALGEGWHNNHHAFPSSAKHGLKKGQIDLSFVFIQLLARANLVSEIRLPSIQQMHDKEKHTKHS